VAAGVAACLGTVLVGRWCFECGAGGVGSRPPRPNTRTTSTQYCPCGSTGVVRLGGSGVVYMHAVRLHVLGEFGSRHSGLRGSGCLGRVGAELASSALWVQASALRRIPACWVWYNAGTGPGGGYRAHGAVSVAWLRWECRSWLRWAECALGARVLRCRHFRSRVCSGGLVAVSRDGQPRSVGVGFTVSRSLGLQVSWTWRLASRDCAFRVSGDAAFVTRCYCAASASAGFGSSSALVDLGPHRVAPDLASVGFDASGAFRLIRWVHSACLVPFGLEG
jgi:hypothetical protein